MALVMLVLYRTPARFYVEHLVFFLHLQSNLFLAMIIEMLLTAAADWWPALNPIADLGGIILFWYAIWYLYAAMRNYYGQSRARTALKFVAVVMAYLFCFALSLGGTMVLSALVT
jgi:hypothetical protein